MTFIGKRFARTLWAPLVAAPLAAVLLFAGADARAAAMFNASALVELQITNIVNQTNPGILTGLIIEGGAEDCACDVPLILEGTGTGSTSLTVTPELTPPDYELHPLGLGDTVTFDLSASGAATPEGYADALREAAGGLFLINETADTFVIDFSLTYALTTSAALGNPLLEDAFAYADLFAGTFIGSVALEEFSEADALYDEFTGPVSDVYNFSLTLGPDGFDAIEVGVAVGGVAESLAVPEASSAAALLAGLVGLGWVRRRAVAK